ARQRRAFSSPRIPTGTRTGDSLARLCRAGEIKSRRARGPDLRGSTRSGWTRSAAGRGCIPDVLFATRPWVPVVRRLGGRSLACRGDALECRASGAVRARQVAQAHQELAGDLAAGELERALEQLHPRGLVARLPTFDGVRIEPFRETAVRGAQAADHPRVVDRRIDFQPVANNAGVGQQAGAVGFAVVGDRVDVEAVV